MRERLGTLYFPATAQLLILAGLAIISWFVFSVIGMVCAMVVLDIDLIGNPELLQDVSSPVNIKAQKLVQVISAFGLFILPPIGCAWLFSREPGKWLGATQRVSVRTLLNAFLAVVVALPLINWLVEWNASMELPEALAGLEAWMREKEDSIGKLTEAYLKMDSAGVLIVNLVFIAVVPAVGEELLFRGGIQRLLFKLSKNPHVAIWATAFLFSFIHLQFYGFVPRFLLGAMFGYLVFWTGSIWPAILAHFTNNAIAVVIGYLVQRETIPGAADQVGSADGEWHFLLASAVLLIALLIPLYRSRNELFVQQH